MMESLAKTLTFAFVPRLVVHKTEVEKICHPQKHDGKSQGPNRNTDTAKGSSETTELESSIGRMLLRGAVPDKAALRKVIAQLTLPEHMGAAPIILAKIAADLPSTLANMAIELPSNLLNVASDLPTAIMSIAEGVEGTLVNIVQISTDVAREVVELPHRASFEWKELIWVLFLLVFAPVLIFGIVFFIPMSSVNSGISHNRGFVYGTMTFYQFLTIFPWIETCNFAMPSAKISVKSRLVTLMFGIFATKLCDAALTEGLFGRNIFPLPFSILLSALLGVSGAVPLLCAMTKSREKIPFGQMQRVLLAYWFSLLMVIVWAVGIQCLMGRPFLWQSAWGFFYGPLRFVCKILIAAPITTSLNPNRWIQLTLVVDILFTRVQVATFPFIDSYITLMLLFSTEVLTLAWRYYNGIDRLALWWNAIWMVQEYNDQSEGNGKTLTCRMTDITKGCFRAPISKIAQLNVTLREGSYDAVDNIVRTLTGDTIIFDDKMSSSSAELEVEIPVCTSSELKSEDLNGCSRITSKQASDIEAACRMADKESCECLESTQSLGSHERIMHREGTDDQNILEGAHFTTCSKAQEYDSTGYRSDGKCTLQQKVPTEEDWEQRPFYHVVDSTGANVISIIVRINQQLSIAMVRNLPSSKHLNGSFQISDDRWREAQIYGWTFIALMLILLSVVGFTFFRRLEGKKLSLSRVMSYLFKDNFWFFFLWLLSTGAFVCASMVNHFGADFSLRFKWISCPDQIIWPGCPV